MYISKKFHKLNAFIFLTYLSGDSVFLKISFLLQNSMSVKSPLQQVERSVIPPFNECQVSLTTGREKCNTPIHKKMHFCLILSCKKKVLISLSAFYSELP